MANGTYSGDPSTSDTDAVRFLIRDTGPDEFLLTDEEISWTLTENPNKYMAASLCATSIASLFGSRARKTIGPLTIDYASQQKTYTDLAADLRNRANTNSRVPGALLTQTNTDHIFALGMHDNISGYTLGDQPLPEGWRGSQA